MTSRQLKLSQKSTPTTKSSAVVFDDDGWRHPAELIYSSGRYWTDKKFFHYCIANALTISPSSLTSPDLLFVSDDKKAIVMNEKYRIPLMFVSRWQWNKLKSLMTAPEGERQLRWQAEKFEVLHIARVWKILTDEGPTKEALENTGYANGKEERICQIKKWRCHTLDRILNRFRMGCFSSEDERVEKFWGEYGETEYVKDVTEFDWERWISEPRDGVTMTLPEFSSGISAEQLMQGLVVNNEFWMWETPENPIPNAMPAWSMRPIAHDLFYRGKAQSSKPSPSTAKSGSKSISPSARRLDTQTPPRARRAQHPPPSISAPIPTHVSKPPEAIKPETKIESVSANNSKPIFGPPRPPNFPHPQPQTLKQDPLQPDSKAHEFDSKDSEQKEGTSSFIDSLKPPFVTDVTKYVPPPEPQRIPSAQSILTSTHTSTPSIDHGRLPPSPPVSAPSTDPTPTLSRKQKKLLSKRKRERAKRAMEAQARTATSANDHAGVHAYAPSTAGSDSSSAMETDTEMSPASKQSAKPVLRVSTIAVPPPHVPVDSSLTFSSSLVSAKEERADPRPTPTSGISGDLKSIPLAVPLVASASGLHGTVAPPATTSVSAAPTLITTIAGSSDKIHTPNVDTIVPTSDSSHLSRTLNPNTIVTSNPTSDTSHPRGIKRPGSPLDKPSPFKARASLPPLSHHSNPSSPEDSEFTEIPGLGRFSALDSKPNRSASLSSIMNPVQTPTPTPTLLNIMGPSTSTTSARATEAKVDLTPAPLSGLFDGEFERKAQGDEYKGVGAAVSGGFNTIMSSTSSGHGRGAVNIVGGDGGASRGESIGANANVGRSRDNDGISELQDIWARSLAHLLV